ncbi:MAG: hypothetical protein IKX91_02560 [Firmicutes bacterium]|nr:hypothetical protein [Bacillota bacterium]
MQNGTAKRTRTPKDYVRTLLFVCLIGVLCAGIIVISAYTANAQYNLNRINNRCARLESEIADVSAKLQRETNITVIEAKAAGLGMVYPTFQQTINLTAGTNADLDLAAALKTVALQTE